MPLYIVSTPIGNMADLSQRGVDTLNSVDIIAAEDTRRSGLLLKKHNIGTALKSYHDHNKTQRTPELVKTLKSGKSVAVISDAGTPGIADPAFYLVRAALAEGIDVIPVPGPSALLAALVASGLPTDRFVFENFLPPKKARRTARLELLKSEERTVIFYESPHRILSTLESMEAVFGDVPVVVARELTKKFETFYRAPVSQIRQQLDKEGVKGEFVVLFNLRAST